MIIKIILIALTIALLIWFLANRKSSQTRAGTKIALFFFLLSAVVVILFPEIANEFAHALGVGRGADLLLYALVIAFTFVAISLYVKSKDEKEQLVILARKIAIIDANNSKHNKNIRK